MPLNVKKEGTLHQFRIALIDNTDAFSQQATLKKTNNEGEIEPPRVRDLNKISIARPTTVEEIRLSIAMTPRIPINQHHMLMLHLAL